MEIILHVGAHRTGTTSFQRAMTQGRGALMRSGTVFWGPQVTRSGRFSGLLRGPGAESGETARLVERNRAVIRMEAVRLATAGTGRLIVSEENTLGSVGTNLRTGLLYPGLPERLARFAHAFDGVARIGIGIRRYQDYWASALAFAVPGGARLPDEGGLDRLVTQPRTWRRVISDIAAAFPGAEIAVWDFDELAGRPDRMFTILTGGCGHLPPMAERHNAAPGREQLREVLLDRGDAEAARAIAPGAGRYMPFAAHHIDAFDGLWADDIAWLQGRAEDRIRFNGGAVRSVDHNRFAGRTAR